MSDANTGINFQIYQAFRKNKCFVARGGILAGTEDAVKLQVSKLLVIVMEECAHVHSTSYY